jgi:protein TonB
MISAAFVALLHILVIYALASGLAARVAAEIPTLLEAEVVRLEQPEEKLPPPPPPEIVQPELPSVPPPSVNIERPAAAESTAITAVAPENLATAQPPAAAATAPVTIAGTHSAPPYPPVARRLGQQGTVLLSVHISASGIVDAVTVMRSSGIVRLDQAAAAWIKQHWRYRPATRGGKPVPAILQVNVHFDMEGRY